MKATLQKILRHPFTLAAVIYLAYTAIRFMLVTDSEWEDVFVLGANRLLHGLDIYQLVPESKGHAYSYPPLQAMLAIPFTLVSFKASRFLWLVINLISVILLWRWSWKAAGGQKLDNQPLLTPSPCTQGEGWGEGSSPASTKIGPTPGHIYREISICILGLVTSMRFVEDNLEHQQTDAVIGILLLGGILLWQRSKTFPAATAWAFAAAMKGPPLLFAPYLAWRGKWLAAIWMVLLAIALNLLPDLIHRAPQGIWLTQWYDEMIRGVSEIGQWHSAPENNQSLAGTAHQLFSQSISRPTLKILVYATELLLVAVSALVMNRFLKPPADTRSAALECSAVMVLMLLLSPMSSKPHFCILLLPGYLLAREVIANRSKSALACLLTAIVLADLLDRNVAGKTIGTAVMQLGSVMWSAASLGLGCLIALRRHPASPAPIPTNI